MGETPASAEVAVGDGVPQPPARPHRTRSQARRGLPGPDGMGRELLDAEWVWDAERDRWRVVTAADDAAWLSGDVSGLAEHLDDELDPLELHHQGGPTPFDQTEALHRAVVAFERWLAEDAEDADDDDRRRVRAVVAERAAMHAAREHAHELRAHQAAVRRAQGLQVRLLAAMAPLYRSAVHHPDSDPDSDLDDDTRSTSRAQRQRESLEAAGLNDLVAEVALLLAWTEHRAGKQVRLAEHEVGCLPRTPERLEAGRLDLALVTVVAEQSLDLDPQLVLELDELVVGGAEPRWSPRTDPALL